MTTGNGPSPSGCQAVAKSRTPSRTGMRRRRMAISCTGREPAAGRVSVIGSPSLILDARIEEAIGDVDEEVHRDDQRRPKQDDAHDHGNIEVVERLERQLSDPGPAEDGL